LTTPVAEKVAGAWHGGWGQDRKFYQALATHFPRYESTGKHTVNYRLGGNEGSVKSEFFMKGNEIVKSNHDGDLPWIKI
jgi:hypothetical protein